VIMMQTLRFGILFLCSLILSSCASEDGEPDSGSSDGVASGQVEARARALSDHAWRLTVVDMADGEDVEPVSERGPVVVFSEEANPTGSRLMNGSTGCNNFNATYDAGRGGRLAVSSAVMTRMACLDDVMRVEQLFMTGLESARTYSVGEEDLIIDFGGGVLRFVADDARTQPVG
jgi:heat shock protein HslJ